MVVPRGLRDRDGRPIVNTAVARTFNNVTGLNFPLFGPWGRYYPWFGNGFGWNYGFVSYNPFIYGNTAWLWNRYGFYDPYGMYGYGSDPYGYYDPYGYGGYERNQPQTQQVGQPTGSLRLRVSPSEAKVYVDGTLMGVVDDFDGLSHHLDIAPGAHTIEFRADGYETYSTTVNVEIGRTVTLRASLNRKK
jgi:hypothetical protein